MTAPCRNSTQLNTALAKAVARVDRAVGIAATVHIAGYVVQEWSGADFTWSRYQPNPVHSGQSRASIRVSRGAPSTDYAPPNPGSWPNHPSPYPMPDTDQLLSALTGLQPYEMVWVSSAVPHAADVERHTQGAHMAAAFARSHFASGYHWGYALNASAEAPF